MTVNPLSTAQIPVSFYPSEIKDYMCTVVVFLNDKIQWRYPIKLIIESKTKNVELSVETRCRDKLEKDFVIHLPGLSTIDPQEPYMMELISVAKGDIDIVKKWFTIASEKSFIDSVSHELRFKVKFNPQKPMKTFGEVLVTRKSGGKWR